MKKKTEMNGTERIAYDNIKGMFDWYVGGWFNCIQDGCTEEIPDTIDQAKQIVYEECLESYARPGVYRTGRAPREMRFAGTEFITEVIDHLFATDGDALTIAEEVW